MSSRIRTYEILDILHSGRKGLRGCRVTNPEYLSMMGCKISMTDIRDFKQFGSARWIFRHHPYLGNWTTSPVMATGVIQPHNEVYYIETSNTIYILCEEGAKHRDFSARLFQSQEQIESEHQIDGIREHFSLGELEGADLRVKIQRTAMELKKY